MTQNKEEGIEGRTADLEGLRRSSKFFSVLRRSCGENRGSGRRVDELQNGTILGTPYSFKEHERVRS